MHHWSNAVSVPRQLCSKNSVIKHYWSLSSSPLLWTESRDCQSSPFCSPLHHSTERWAGEADRRGWLRLSADRWEAEPGANPGMWADPDFIVAILPKPWSALWCQPKAGFSRQRGEARCQMKRGHRSAEGTALLWYIGEGALETSFGCTSPFKGRKNKI